MTIKECKFYNMQVNLIKNGKIYAERAAIRNVWQKDNNTFLDIYLYRLNKSYVFDSGFIHDITDNSREKYYKDVGKFVSDFYAICQTTSVPTQSPNSDNAIFSSIKDDLIILRFLSEVLKNKKDIKDKIIREYIRSTVKSAQKLSDRYLDEYINSITPDSKEFYEAVSNLKSKMPKQAEELLRNGIKLCLSDGYLEYYERMYLADLIEALRSYGLSLSSDII